MTTELITEMSEFVNKYGGENTATHLMVQAIQELRRLQAENEALRAQRDMLLRDIHGGEPENGELFFMGYREQVEHLQGQVDELTRRLASPAGDHKTSITLSRDCFLGYAGDVVEASFPALTRPSVLDEDDLYTIERAADLLEIYAEFIESDVMSADIERHPYQPEIELTAKGLREIAAAPQAEAPQSNQMADEYRRWIDFFHRGNGDYNDFLRVELAQPTEAQKGGA